ncbi:MAG: ankyrin repeat domain-containing protein [Leptospirales bacterium]
MKSGVRKFIYFLFLCILSGILLQCKKFTEYSVHHYASKGDTKAVLYHLDHGVNVNIQGEYGNTILYNAINGFYDSIENKTGAQKEALRFEFVKILISRGADINIPNDRGWTPLYISIMGGNIEIVKLLLENGANIHVEVEGMSILRTASAHESIHPELTPILDTIEDR